MNIFRKEFDMKKILTALLLAVFIMQANFSSASHVPEPAVKMDEKFTGVDTVFLECGHMVSSYYYDKEGNNWGRHAVVSKTQRVVALILINSKGEKFLWLYRSDSNHPDEYYTDHEAFLKKYPTSCNVFIK